MLSIHQEYARASNITVVVTVKGEDAAECALSLKEQSYGEPYEVLVVEGGNRSQARNAGIAQSNTPLVAFIDADCEAPFDWLANLISSLPRDRAVAGVGGVSGSRDTSLDLEKAIDGLYSTYVGSVGSPSLLSLPKSRKTSARALSTHNSVFRRTALVEVNGFDERFQLNEDTDICARLRRKGYRLILDHDIFVYHRRRDTLIEFAHQFFSYGIGRTRSMFTSKGCIDVRLLGLFLIAMSIILLAPARPMLFLSTLLAYLVLISAGSIAAAKRIHAPRLILLIIVCFVVEHLSYLVGMACGLPLGPWKEIWGSGPAMKIHRYSIVDGSIEESEYSTEHGARQEISN